MNEPTDITIFAKELFLMPSVFFKKYFNRYSKPPFFLIALIIFGLGYGIDRLGKSVKPGGSLDYWSAYWLAALVGGFAGGFIIYLIGGWFYNVRLKWSGGTSDIETSRYIFLYSAVVASAAILLSATVTFILATKPSDDISIYYSFITILFLMAFSFYSVYVSFCGVTAITDVEHKKARLWFLIIPIAVYGLSYIVVLRPYLTYFINY